ncbi:MAG: tRNA 2-thiouridine(34) synthase MnmA [Lawsonibacter sp.]|jgi:tRNA-specific 2-thiouridylase
MCAKVAVAMSGGVDSSAVAWLLLQEGHTLTGVTMDLSGCGFSSDAVSDARAVAQQLGFPHLALDLKHAFQQQVMDPFVRCYEAGKTPNPCIQCNRRLKFGALLDHCLALGLDALATGHYVRRQYDSGSGRYLLQKAAHLEKDQSYVLYSLTQTQLAHSLFPLGALSKEEVRSLAQAHHLASAHKKESQDICFIPDGDYAAFLARYSGHSYPPGPFLDEAGHSLGSHNGIVHYTVGQRRGLGISSNHGRLYVKELRPEENAVVLCQGSSLFSPTLIAEQVNFIPFDRLDAPLRLRAKIRYRMAEQPCTVEQVDSDTVFVRFDQPQRAITPGQAVVFYDGDIVVGGATIRKGAY